MSGFWVLPFPFSFARGSDLTFAASTSRSRSSLTRFRSGSSPPSAMSSGLILRCEDDGEAAVDDLSWSIWRCSDAMRSCLRNDSSSASSAASCDVPLLPSSALPLVGARGAGDAGPCGARELEVELRWREWPVTAGGGEAGFAAGLAEG